MYAHMCMRHMWRPQVDARHFPNCSLPHIPRQGLLLGPRTHTSHLPPEKSCFCLLKYWDYTVVAPPSQHLRGSWGYQLWCFYGVEIEQIWVSWPLCLKLQSPNQEFCSDPTKNLLKIKGKLVEWLGNTDFWPHSPLLSPMLFRSSHPCPPSILILLAPTSSLSAQCSAWYPVGAQESFI